jgi:membrane protein implicated in regulation of membrane protease activity
MTLMADATVWWLATGLVVLLELFTGTFYLLMLAVGLAAGALAAHAQLGLSGQLVVAALVGATTVSLAYLRRRRRPGAPSARADRSVNLDIGETIHIEAWNSDGTAQVRYRGAQWTALARPGSSPTPGAHRVAELVGNRLLVDKI